MKVVVAPNPFKGSLGAPAAAAAIAAGVRRAASGAEVVMIPVADGGEGTAEALLAARGGRWIEVEVVGPLGDPVRAGFALLRGERTAVVELAAAAGLDLVPTGRRDPRRTSTFGFGQLLEAARRQGVTEIIAGIGGSATNDGGAGMAQALGYRLLDATGAELPGGGGALCRLARIEVGGATAWRGPGRPRVLVACDVTNPLCGPQGASAVYGPQKGADPQMVEELDRCLARLADRLEADLGAAVRDLPGAGAAGGAGAGLVAFCGAELARGAPMVIAAAGLEEALEGADLVITGEGRADFQTGFGKGPAEVAARAAARGIPCVILAGSLGPGAERLIESGFTAVLPVAEGPAELDSMLADAPGLLERAAERLTRVFLAGASAGAAKRPAEPGPKHRIEG